MPGEDCTYKSLLGAIFKNRRLRIGSEHNDKADLPLLLAVKSSLLLDAKASTLHLLTKLIGDFVA